jgi:hypothetical protein
MRLVDVKAGEGCRGVWGVVSFGRGQPAVVHGGGGASATLGIKKWPCCLLTWLGSYYWMR